MPVLTLLDTLALQSFIFATQRLKDAVSGSELVKQLEDWVREICGSNAVVAGGNAIVRFETLHDARTAVMRLSRKVYDNAPGLELAAAHRDYSSGDLANALLQAQRELQASKLSRRPSVPLLGLSVTEPCRETRLVATDSGWEDEGIVPLSRTVKLRRKPEFAESWREFLPANPDDFSRDGGMTMRVAFPMEVEMLGRSHGDRSLLGLVHVDGNGVGRLLAEWLKMQAENAASDDRLISDLQNISAAIQRIGDDALRRVLNRVVGAIRWNDESGEYEVNSSHGDHLEMARSRDATERLFLPLRPLIFGGDDITFLCDGRLALDLAETALGAFESAVVPVLEKPLRACAGVAIGRSHTPIAKLFHLAEELCRSAKQRVRDESPDACGIDWHIAFQSPVETLSQLRKRQYRVGIGAEDFELTARPYLLGALNAPERETWRWLSSIVLGKDGAGFRSTIWSDRRSKLKTLRELVRDGRDAVKRARAAWAVTSPGLRFPAGVPEDGFMGRKTVLLDAIELLDLHWLLEESEHAST